MVKIRTVDLEQSRLELQAHFCVEEHEMPPAEQSSAHARGSRVSGISCNGEATPIAARAERIERRENFIFSLYFLS
jgi:hypothetical protein